MKPNTNNVRYIGRWVLEDTSAIATAPGSRFLLAFSGKNVVLHFSVEFLSKVHPHLWISVDGEARIEVPVDRHIRIETSCDGNHVVEVLLKSSMTMGHRWHMPLDGRLEFIGWDGESGILPESTRKTIEFVGDSITEGVFVDEALGDGLSWEGRPYQDDVTATYAWTVAQALDLDPIISAYGGVGVCEKGCEVPPAPYMYPYCYEKEPIPYRNPNYILMNFGANDRQHSKVEFITEYQRLIETIRGHNPLSQLIILSPFCGAFEHELLTLVEEYRNKGVDIAFISSRGWIPEEPLHPLREGHKVLAEKLLPEMKKIVLKQ